FGQSITFTARVSHGSQVPTGTFTFYDGLTALGTVALSGDSAQTSTAILTAGSHTIKAVYSGDNNFSADSSSITQTVNQATASVTLSSSLNPSTFGQNVTFTARL